jgi:hypothetical protein
MTLFYVAVHDFRASEGQLIGKGTEFNVKDTSTDPVEISIDNLPFHVRRDTFLSSARPKILAECSAPGCHSILTFGGEIHEARKLKFLHNLCGGLVENIPLHIWQEYRDKKFDPDKAVQT